MQVRAGGSGCYRWKRTLVCLPVSYYPDCLFLPAPSRDLRIRHAAEGGYTPTGSCSDYPGCGAGAVLELARRAAVDFLAFVRCGREMSDLLIELVLALLRAAAG